MTPVQVRAGVLDNLPAGAYRRIVLAAPGVGAAIEPGQFVALAVGDEPTATLLRRCFSVHRASADPDVVEIVVAAHGAGSTWVTRRRPEDVVDVVGPLGRPFPLPEPAADPGTTRAAGASTRCVLVGGGYGSAPLVWLAERLVTAGHGVDLVLGAATAARLFGVDEGQAAGARLHVTTDDGSAGVRGRVTAALPPLLGPGVEVYACGPMAMLKAVAESAARTGATAWVAVEESMACGIGVCMTCVLPVRGADGTTRMLRSCVDGPTFAAEAVRWDAVLAGPGGKGSAVPGDCLGSPAASGGHA